MRNFWKTRMIFLVQQCVTIQPYHEWIFTTSCIMKKDNVSQIFRYKRILQTSKNKIPLLVACSAKGPMWVGQSAGSQQGRSLNPLLLNVKEQCRGRVQGSELRFVGRAEPGPGMCQTAVTPLTHQGQLSTAGHVLRLVDLRKYHILLGDKTQPL